MNILITGFPGFLGSELLPRLLERDPGDAAICLVRPRFAAVAQARLASILAVHPKLEKRIQLVEGDITARIDVDTRAIGAIYHLASIYDLAVAREDGMRVNVGGTRNVLELAERCGGFRRLHYISTCYVSGRWSGLFTEADLEKGQLFNNFYEETKQLAEIEVRKRMRDGIPATIYRPSVVVGDSVTGATQKLDGPYFVMQWLLRQSKVAFLPVAGNPGRYKLNVVPSDFITRAIVHLSGLEESLGRTYHLADPDPLSVDETIRVLAGATGRRVIRIPMPKVVTKGALKHVPGLYDLMRIPPAAVDYFVHPTEYATTNASRDLGAITVPRFASYAQRLVDFARAHPEIGSAAIG